MLLEHYKIAFNNLIIFKITSVVILFFIQQLWTIKINYDFYEKS